MRSIVSMCFAMALAGAPASAEVKLQCRSGQVTRTGLKLGKPVDRPFVLDHRYSPPYWQTSICLPDDWQKTLVGKDGAMLYDWPGKFAGFATRVTVSLSDKNDEWVSQRLEGPRAPIVVTTTRQGGVELVTRAFAVTDESLWPTPPATSVTARRNAPRGIERIGTHATLAGWARPGRPANPAFADIDVGWNDSLRYRFKAEPDKRYHVAFGLCEGYWDEQGRRVLDLKIEGRVVDTVDPVKARGRNRPFVRMFEATDCNGDGWIEVEVAAADAAKDKNTILNVLWVFDELPPPAMIVAGKATAQAIGYLPCGAEGPRRTGPPRADLLVASMRNRGDSTADISPRVTVQSHGILEYDGASSTVWVSGRPMIRASIKPATAENADQELILTLPAMAIEPGGSSQFVVAFHNGADAVSWSVGDARRALDAARSYWRGASLPYGVLSVPDPAVQALLDSSIRNIYQAREIKNDLPAFQVGPTCYRGLWVIDGAFLLESITLLNRADETRAGVQYLLSHQKPDGSFELLRQYWKETGIVLWVIDRHEQLTGDREWLAGIWPRVTKAVGFVQELRRRASQDPNAPHAGLVPPGYSDGGLNRDSEYTNVYWILSGLKSAIDMARRMGKTEQAEQWRREYDDMWATFRAAAKRDLYTDEFGNKMLPVPMSRPLKKKPHKALWAFAHAIYPGEIFKPDDPIMLGTMASLTDNECEGLVKGTGWLDDGIWNYFASFYGHAFAWLGQGRKAAQILYAFGNHASPLLAWREEQDPIGQGEAICGDMPHNWASAEFIRLTMHLLVFERGDELHLLEGLPPTWLKPGAETSIDNALTRFGPFSMKLRVSADARTATLAVTPPTRTSPSRIVVHTGNWASTINLDGEPLADGHDLDVSAKRLVTMTLELTGK